MVKPKLAYVAVTIYPESERPFSLGIAVEGEQGYHPTDYPGVATYEEASKWADELNGRLGLSRIEAAKIVSSTMVKPKRGVA